MPSLIDIKPLGPKSPKYPQKIGVNAGFNWQKKSKNENRRNKLIKIIPNDVQKRSSYHSGKFYSAT